jgi:hypothetical protein
VFLEERIPEISNGRFGVIPLKNPEIRFLENQAEQPYRPDFGGRWLLGGVMPGVDPAALA